jgi:3-oxoacyl-[acyl-carrier protein] reductase
MDLGIAGRRAAVAAASTGLGRATAAALVREGAIVAICGRERVRLDAAAAQIGGGVVTIVADVSSPAGCDDFVGAATDALGGIDILVTNAGGPPPGTFATTAVDAYQAAIDLNLLSVVAMCKAAVPGMQQRRWGRVVAITSVAVRQPIANLILSNTARTGATGFLKTLAREVAVDNVTVNSVLPGMHATERLLALGYDPQAAASSTVGDPDDFAAVVTFLCSEQAKFLTGAAIQVDGGAYAGLL